MKELFNKEQLKNIDASVPDGACPPDEYFWFVMDYNDSTVFGKLVDMRTLITKNSKLERMLSIP
jgi:hypothetical protein